jgi:membrane protease YdiL (CAAX protease family)
MNLLAPLRHHPIAGFVALTCLWSFSWWTLILAVVPPGALLRGPPVPSALAFMVLGSAGPVLASLAMTVARSGRGGIQELAGRLLRWRVGRWWLVVLAPWLMNAVLALAFSLGGGEVSGAAIVGKLGPAVGLGVMASLCEEPGWRGYLFPRLRERYAPVPAALLVGLVWGGLWHGYADWIGLGDLGWRAVPLIVLYGPVLLSAHAVLLGHLYERTRGSLLLAVAYHFSVSASGFALGLEYPTYGQNLAWTAFGVAVAWLVVGATMLATSSWGATPREA